MEWADIQVGNQHYWLLFLSIYLIIWGLECWQPIYTQYQNRTVRSLSHWGLFFLNTGLIQLLSPVLLILLAMLPLSLIDGGISQMDLAITLKIGLACLFLDAAMYGWHRLLHYWHPLWCIHRIHHTDREVDVSTSIRHHPLEDMASLIYLSCFALLLGIPIDYLLVYHLIAMAVSLFSHANLNLPSRLTSLLNLVIVTPSVHRVHHALDRQQTEHNFASVLTIWDRLFGTYQAQSVESLPNLVMGVEGFSSSRSIVLTDLLMQPIGSPSSNPSEK